MEKSTKLSKSTDYRPRQGWCGR